MRIREVAIILRLFLLGLLLGLPKALESQKAPVKVTTIVVNCTCDDTVGKGYARSLRDVIAKSPRYDEVTDSKEHRKTSILISVVTLPIDDDAHGAASTTAISVVFVVDDIFLSQYVQLCGEKVTEACAQKTLDGLDDVISKFK